MKDIPLGLRHSLESGECVLFIGAGIGKYFINQEGQQAPTAIKLAGELSSHFSIATSNTDLKKISRIVELRKGRPELISFLSKRLSDLQPDEIVKWISTLKWKAIYTTNYDNGLQKAYDISSNPKQKYVTITSTSEIVPFDSRFDVPIYHLHGALFDSQSPGIVITEDDYAKYKEKRRMLFNLLKHHFITSNILYIGFSNSDYDWQIVLNEIEQEFYPSSMPTSYRIAPETDAVDREILEAKKLFSIDMNFEEFVANCASTLRHQEIDSEKLSKYESMVPAGLIEAFHRNPVAVTRLLSSWTYVNQEAFSESPNTKMFLEGDKPNWALVGSGGYFERDIEEELFDDLLDYATSTKDVTNVKLLLGSAGYGITTLLMALAAKLVNTRAGAVYMLKPAHPLLQGDIEFATSISNEKVFFFIDNAADHLGSLRSIIQHCRETKKSALFMIGERLNEWRQITTVGLGKEYLVEPLSDPEINRLLDYLGNHSALNKLEYLPRNLQFLAVKRNYNQELLVAMREATEDQRFDAILESEFWGIEDPLSRTAYLAVCCFYLHGVYLRDSLLSDLLEIQLSDLDARIGRSTSGVIIYDEIDSTSGMYGARARARKIAEVVWERCGARSEKSTIVKRVLDSLNLNYVIDKNAFESFYRSDHLVDSIGSLDDKLEFFEKSCRKDPESPYVRQHYSRMLYRENKLDLALSKIDTAIEIDKKAKVLYHTKGLILSKIAAEVDSLDIARKRLAQAENCFRRGISLAPKDPYCYQGLAELYLNWAGKSLTDSEATEYIEKAEEIIGEGLREVRMREYLWILSARIQSFLGNHPGYLQYLERAVHEHPESITARYLLGRAFRKNGNYNKAADILEPLVLKHPEHYRSYVEYSLCLFQIGKNYKECIAILQQSTLYGFYDPRFIATLGGMLFMDCSFSTAEQVFSEYSKRNFTAEEANTIQYRACDPTNRRTPLRVEGRVVNVKAGFSWIESTGYPKAFFCPGSKYKGLLMEKGLKVTFQVAFNAKGAIADDPASR
ncbi:MAG: SIR2 family protein [Deltaproteobacteria bacterium]|nr:SIR2 family protein [Deltaproteobacteria bacterium]